MIDLTTLNARLDQLRGARATGARIVRYSDGREVEYKSDAEMTNAIADLERQIAAACGARPLNVVRFATRKGC